MGDWRKRLIVERQFCDPALPHGCGARTGDWCKTKDGGRARQPHQVREQAAVLAGDLPLKGDDGA